MADNTTSPSTSPFATQRPSDEALYQHEVENKNEQRHKLANFLRGVLAVLGAIITAYFIALAVLFLLGWTAAPLPFTTTAATDDAAPTVVADSGTLTVADLSDEQLAAQMCMIVVDGASSKDFAMHNKQGIGALVLTGTSHSSSLVSDISVAQKNAANSVQSFIVSDEIGDYDNPLNTLSGTLPSAKELSKLSSSEIAALTEEHGRKLQDAGVNLVLGPSADLGDPAGGLAKEGRSFGTDRNKVAESANAWTSGMGQANVGTVLGHWPGLGGYADARGVVTTYRSWQELQEDEVQVFIDSVDGNVTMILVTHVIVPDFTEDSNPTSISQNAMQYLRKNFGDVILLSDDVGVLVRDGVCDASGSAAVEAINAGADMIMYRSRGANDTTVVDELTNAISTGKISRAQAETKVERILRAKMNMGLAPQLVTSP
ncbi:MAG: hypothetical protein FWE87_05565 [Coriobacteriia bacterium]|nr:hypothetical protein [Coriobacteriia bacterium]